MLHRLIRWSVDNPLVVLLLAAALVAFGGYAFFQVDVEAYPDPAPAIVEVIAKYPGASAEEVERQVTIPLEVALAGMPGLKYTRSKSLFGLAHLRNQFDYGIDYLTARQEVINRLTFVEGLPNRVQPFVSPQTPTGEILRYALRNPKNLLGQEIYALHDLKSLQDWTLERQFRRVPRIIDVVGVGGTVKRYEIQPDPYQLIRYGITLGQVEDAIQNSNANIGGDYLSYGSNLFNVRGLGLIGGGFDAMRSPEVLAAREPATAAAILRADENHRLREIRQKGIAAVNNLPIRVDDVVDGGPLLNKDDQVQRGVLVSHLSRLGKVSVSRPALDSEGNNIVDARGARVWIDEEEKVQGVVLLRKGEPSLRALRDVKLKIDELNTQPGRLLPGVKIEPYYDRTDLVDVTTETVRENLLLGMTLVTLVLLMFVSNVRSAIIVAVNIPLALLFAFSVLYLRGKSANLLSIGAIDFGIIVDSSVIMVENIYRHISSGEYPELSFKERLLKACHEVERSLFFSTAIMVCAFLPLFTMQGPEGQIFGPMADTYAFSLCGALLLAITVAPVLCWLFFRNLKPIPDNFLVRFLKRRYLWQLKLCLDYRWATLGIMGTMIAVTVYLLPDLGREFMPELDEGNLYIRGTLAINTTLEAAAEQARRARAVIRSYPEVELVVSQIGRPDDGTDPTSFYNTEYFVPLKPRGQWPANRLRAGWRQILGATRCRTREELVNEMSAELETAALGVNWNFSQHIRDNVMEALSGVKGDNSVKIIGPDLDELERLAQQTATVLGRIPGIRNVGVFRVKGQPNLEFPVDPAKCNLWAVSVSDVEEVVQTAVGGHSFSEMIEGEKAFDIALRWPESLRANEQAILDIPVDVSKNRIRSGSETTIPGTPQTGAEANVNPLGTNLPMPSLVGSRFGGTFNNPDLAPRRRLGDFVTPVDSQGRLNPQGSFTRPGASTIYREQGNRLIAVKFSVRDRDLAGAVAEAQAKTSSLFQAPYRTEWSGEFLEMREAEHRLLFIVPVSLALIIALLYFAFHSLLDTFAVLSNVADVAVGGVWALYLTGTHFSVSAAVGFISLFGVAVMDGLLLISYFNQLRLEGLPLHDAILQGAEKRLRPVMMTALTAVLGLLPAALSTRIGAQTQRPLAIVVVGGMLTTLLLTRYLMPVLYSFYGQRQPSDSAQKLAD